MCPKSNQNKDLIKILKPYCIIQVKKHFPENTHLWIADIDLMLNDNGYIVPGLGDAGNLSYGIKRIKSFYCW